MIALVGVIIAQFLRYAAVMTLGERWNTRIIVMPDAAPVTRGLYRWMRHPNYVAVVIEIAALPMIRGCWITAGVFTIANALMLAVRIPAEERALGANYSAAFGDVGRFFPRLPHPATVDSRIASAMRDCYHRAMVFAPFLVFYALIFIGVLFLWLMFVWVGVISNVFQALGLPPNLAFIALLMSFLGSYINIPAHRG